MGQKGNYRDNTLVSRVSIRSNFRRSVYLPTDWGNEPEQLEYLATPTIIGYAEQIVQELAMQGGDRAWTITGPFGAGKSAFALFLADLLCKTKPSHVEAQRLRDINLPSFGEMFPIFVQAERKSLAFSIAKSIQQKCKFSKSISAQAENILSSTADSSTCVELILSVANTVTSGIVIFVDELGKYLEYAASKDNEDVYLLQQIAEAATRATSGVLFVGILHSGFADYFTTDSGAHQSEWQKVQGRFRDIPFSLPVGQLLHLIGKSIETDFPDKLQNAYTRRLSRILSKNVFSQHLANSDFMDTLASCLPLHPVTALLLPSLFRSEFSQNERSLFSFLTSHEPYGFREYLEQAPLGKSSELYRLPNLYNYVVNSLGMCLLTGRDSRQWGLIVNALDRLPADAPELCSPIVKTIGLLNFYGTPTGLSASETLICRVLDNQIRQSILQSIEYLKNKSILVYRQHAKSFRLWEGSDLNLGVVFNQAYGALSNQPLYQRIQRLAIPAPVIARAYYIKTGNLRIFESRLSGFDDEAINSSINEKTEADGILLYLVDTSPQNQVVNRAAEISKLLCSDKPVIVVLPDSNSQLHKTTENLECWTWVLENTAELDGDPVARQEVVAQLAESRNQFEQIVGSTLGLGGHALDPSSSSWFFGGKKCDPHPRSSRDVQRFLSEVCEASYPCAPTLRNELLNRNRLSNAASAARRKLIEKILLSDAESPIVIDGFPPERSMFDAVLVQGGFVDSSGILCFPHAESEWRHVWKKVEEFLDNTKTNIREVNELFDLLQSPPFGIRKGPLPVVISLVLRLMPNSVSLYEESVFVHEFQIEALERLVRNPQTFSLRYYKPVARQIELVSAVRTASEFLWDDHEKLINVSEVSGSLDIVKNLVGMVSRLTPFAQKTKILSENALSIRKVLMEATDPYSLLLKDIPKALGVEPDESVQVDVAIDVATPLHFALEEVQNSYPKLLEKIEELIAQNFGFPVRDEELKNLMRHRLEPLKEHTDVTSRLGVFVREATRVTPQGDSDWRKEIARVILDGKPPTQWQDSDLAVYATRLRILVNDCDSLTNLIAAQGGDINATVANFGFLSPDFERQHAVIAFPNKRREPVTELKQRIRQCLDESDLDSRSQLMALAITTCELLQEDGDDYADTIELSKHKA